MAVVGGGVAGLAAAYRLRRSLGPAAEIVVIEQTDRLGGKLRTVELAGRPFDVGAEAFLARRPEVPELASELGLADRVVHPAAASSRIRAGGRNRAIPSGTVMGVPTSAEAVREVLSAEGVAAVAAEQELPTLHLGGADAPVGELLRERVGGEVVDRLVEPLLGGVYAGTADSLGLRATMPALAAALDGGAGSITAAARSALPAPAAPDAPKPPVFGAFDGGYRQLVDALVRESAAEVRHGLPVRALHRNAAGWRLELGSAPEPEELDADAVVLAVPAPAARRLLSGVLPAASESLDAVELASMIVVGLALPAGTELPDWSGALIAKGEVHADGTPFTAKAFTFSSRKWPHLRGTGGELLVRGSVGRFGEAAVLRRDDAEILRRVRADLAELTGVDVEPADSGVYRWGGGLPQYGTGHLDTVDRLERAVGEIDGIAIAGAALHGVGVPACVSTGDAAATEITRHLLAD
ncbi:protoporphyrinogen oxidase [Parasphingorhabdus pacifica]